MALKPNADRMQAAVVFVTEHPGTSMRSAIAHVLGTFEEARRDKPTAYKRAASAVERVIKDRHVRQGADMALFPWDAKRKAFAEALERAFFAAPTADDCATLEALVCQAWRKAGDENRARTLSQLKRWQSFSSPNDTQSEHVQ